MIMKPFDTPHPPRWLWILPATLLAAVPATRAGAQDARADTSLALASHATFHISTPARLALQRLWESSIAAREERVACLGGYATQGAVHITHIVPLEASRADSANISALASLRECGPPNWFGTVHTHIAKHDGKPYTMFSAPDRYVMFLWRDRWKEDGVFCILYSESEANCEAGELASRRAVYGNARGNNIIF
jgi:hypothetical protein